MKVKIKMDNIELIFSLIVFASVFFTVLLHQNIYYSAMFLLPGIFSFFVFAVEWLGVNQTVLSILMFIIIISFLTVSIIFAKKYMDFHYSDIMKQQGKTKGDK